MSNHRLYRHAVCTNPFGCSAGAAPWRYGCELDLGTCRACRLRDGDEGAALIRIEEFRHRVDCCPMCMLLLPDHGAEVPDLREPASLERFKRDLSQRNWSDVTCNVCGFVPHRVAETLLQLPDRQSTILAAFDILQSALDTTSMQDLAKLAYDSTIFCSRRIDEWKFIRLAINGMSGRNNYSWRVLNRKLNLIEQELDRYLVQLTR